MSQAAAAFVWQGREFQIDARCLAGPPVRGAWAHVCALPDPEARIPFDQPEVQQARRDALAWWIGLLADDLVCLSTLALDDVYYGGAITVARSHGPVRARPVRAPVPRHGDADRSVQPRGPASGPDPRALRRRALAGRPLPTQRRAVLS